MTFASSSTMTAPPADDLAGSMVGPDSYRMEDYAPERRRQPRLRLRLRAEARRLDNTLLAHRAPRLSLTINDVSNGGLSALSRSPVEVGERLAVAFPPGSGAPLSGRVLGKVIRCRATAQGWRLAMRFDLTPAA